MVQVLDPTPTQRLPSSSVRARWAALVAAIVTGIGLGALGNALVSPGESLAVPTAIVATIGGAIVLVSWVVASFRATRQAGWIFALGVGVVTVLASAWTFEFALPAAVEWSGATAQAQNALSALQHSPQNRNGTVPPHPCVLYASGSIGPLAAPYRQCTIWTPVGHLVTFVASGPGATGGLVYTDRPSSSFADQCARHLIGDWWMFAPSSDAGGDPGSCYIGYTFRGGG
jgi:multisubunit Na+/H+ antiporter MnhB subunit